VCENLHVLSTSSWCWNNSLKLNPLFTVCRIFGWLRALCRRWAIWLAAVLGTAYTFLFFEKYKLLDTMLYVFVGVTPGLVLQYYNTNDATYVFSCFVLFLWNSGCITILLKLLLRIPNQNNSHCCFVFFFAVFFVTDIFCSIDSFFVFYNGWNLHCGPISVDS